MLANEEKASSFIAFDLSIANNYGQVLASVSGINVYTVRKLSNCILVYIAKSHEAGKKPLTSMEFFFTL